MPQTVIPESELSVQVPRRVERTARAKFHSGASAAALLILFFIIVAISGGPNRVVEGIRLYRSHRINASMLAERLLFPGVAAIGLVGSLGRLFLPDWRAYNLCKHGSVAFATVVKKEVRHYDETSGEHIHTSWYLVEYEFIPDKKSGAPRLMRETAPVFEADWKSVSEGDTVTILYEPDDPSTNLIYEFCEYKAA